MWLLSQNFAAEMRSAIAASALPSAAERAEYIARETLAEEEAIAATNMPRIMKIAGSTAQISVTGVLTESFDIFAWLFGGGNTTYESIRASLALSASDPTVKDVVLYLKSPGGTVDGLFETLAAFEIFPKKVRVVAARADSAAYALAASAGPIEATTEASEFGSIGVAIEYHIYDDVVDITSTDAPNKRPDVTTEQGRATVREYLDSIHALFVDAIAAGRNRNSKRAEDFSADEVNEKFGGGSVFVARDALRRGMIDKVPARTRAKTRSAMVADVTDADAPAISGSAEGTEKEEKMDLKTLRTQHPDLYNEVREEAHASGVAQERDRVVAHLMLGEKFGAMDVASEAIKDGSAMTMTLNARYLSAAADKSNVESRQNDGEATEQATGGTPETPEAERDLGDEIADIMFGKAKA